MGAVLTVSFLSRTTRCCGGTQGFAEITRSVGCLGSLQYAHHRAATEELLTLSDAIAWCWAKGGHWRSNAPVVAGKYPNTPPLKHEIRIQRPNARHPTRSALTHTDLSTQGLTPPLSDTAAPAQNAEQARVGMSVSPGRRDSTRWRRGKAVADAMAGTCGGVRQGPPSFPRVGRAPTSSTLETESRAREGDAVSAWDVVLGGGVTLAGTVLTQVVAVRVARGQRTEARRLASANYDRIALEQVQEAAKIYRTVLVAYNNELRSTSSTTGATELSLQQSRMDYQALVHRVDSAVVQRLGQWESVAVSWSQGEGSAAAEEAEWNGAMALCGQVLRSTLR